MAKYTIKFQVEGHCIIEVEAESEREAVGKMKSGDGDFISEETYPQWRDYEVEEVEE
jgi:hypothetical protein